MSIWLRQIGGEVCCSLGAELLEGAGETRKVSPTDRTILAE